jgi:hypothetical protein
MGRGSESGRGDRQSPLRQANTALVRTAQRLSVGVQADLPPHNFPVMQLELSVKARYVMEFNQNLTHILNNKYEGDSKNLLLDQYKMYVEMHDRISARRNQMNSFFISRFIATPEKVLSENRI